MRITLSTIPFYSYSKLDLRMALGSVKYDIPIRSQLNLSAGCKLLLSFQSVAAAGTEWRTSKRKKNTSVRFCSHVRTHAAPCVCMSNGIVLTLHNYLALKTQLTKQHRCIIKLVLTIFQCRLACYSSSEWKLEPSNSRRDWSNLPRFLLVIKLQPTAWKKTKTES